MTTPGYAKTLMVQGTTSDAGKSILVAGLCRVLARRGCRVAPFKPQNMALNSAVTSDGGEIGRAQALQAMACRLQPHTDMNPILLKPSSDTGAQVVIHGKAVSELDARAYHDYKRVAMTAVLESHERLCQQYDFIVVEGAGSPAEINLHDNQWPDVIARHLRYGGKLIGICGGFQMLGQHIDDPQGIEGPAGSSQGLGLLEIVTVLQPEKFLQQVTGTLCLNGVPVEGYEIHCGVSSGAALARSAVTLVDGRSDGVLSADERILGTYLHGLFDDPQARDELLRWAGLAPSHAAGHMPSVADVREQQLERLADMLESELDCAALFSGAVW